MQAGTYTDIQTQRNTDTQRCSLIFWSVVWVPLSLPLNTSKIPATAFFQQQSHKNASQWFCFSVLHNPTSFPGICVRMLILIDVCIFLDNTWTPTRKHRSWFCVTVIEKWGGAKFGSTLPSNADIQAHRHTDMQTYRHTDTKTYRHTSTKTCRHADIKKYRHHA